MIKFFYDLETTGVLPYRHSIHRIAGCIEVDGKIVETFDIKTRPNPKAIIEQEALDIGKVTLDQVMSYLEMHDAYKTVVAMLAKYVDRYDKRDKMWLVGYNNRSFDDLFFRAWFEQNDDAFFGAWFWSASLDVLVLASQYLLDRRRSMLNFKLPTVARELGIPVDKDRLHEARYDVELTREIYRLVTRVNKESIL